MPKTVADYSDAVRRIAEADVPDDATTQAEVKRALAGSDAPQVTPDVAADLADAIITEERVLDAIEASGEIPHEGELDAITAVSDDYEMEGRIDAVAEKVRDRVATVEDVATAVNEVARERQDAGEPTFRENVESAVNEVAQDREFVGESPAEVAGEQARQIGAPSRSDYERARTQVITSADQVSPADVLGEEEATAIQGVGETTAKRPAQVIRDSDGNAVGLTGAPTEEAGEQMAQELGADYLSINEVNEQITLDQQPGEATLRLRGRRVGEVEVE